MTTEKLYYEDSGLREFKARVVSAEEKDGFFETELDRTAFYPGGGGQDCDTGEICGVPVVAVFEDGERILHRTEQPVPKGEVFCRIDGERRDDLTQQHSGEHIVSGLLHSRFGAENVGFHIGGDVVTVDWNKPVSMEELLSVEKDANRYIREDHQTEIFWPTEEELRRLEYRSKGELEGRVRIVRFPGADTCACCGTHVCRTGEIGLVKILSARSFKGGIRVEMVSGARAEKAFSAIWANNRAIAQKLSAQMFETADVFASYQEETEHLKQEIARLRRQHAEDEAQRLNGCGDVLLFEENLEMKELGKLCDAVMETCGGCCAVFSGTDGSYRYAVGKKNSDIRDLVREMNRKLCGRGGGREPFFAQGSVRAHRSEIEDFWKTAEQ